MKTAAFITAQRADAEVDVKTTVEDDRVVFDVPQVGRANPHGIISFDVVELREALDTLAPSGRALNTLAAGQTARRVVTDSPQA